METSLSEQLSALDQGRAAVDLSNHRVIEVTGADATTWLDALVTTGVARMSAGEARASFLLQPTGRVRASFLVAKPDADERFLLIQPSGQPKDVDAILGMYRLTSDVTLTPRDDAVFLVVGAGASGETPAATWNAVLTTGSQVAGSGATETLVGAARADAGSLRSALGASRALIDDPDLLSTALGRASFPRDLTVDSLPLEASEQLGDAIDHDKGCYLGQEAIAKTRNFGRTPFVLLPLSASAPVAPGTSIIHSAGGDDEEAVEVGVVTSATTDGMSLMARIRAKAAAQPLATSDGTALTPRG